MLRQSRRHRHIADIVKILVFNRNVPSPTRGHRVVAYDAFHHFLPGASAQLRVCAVQIHSGQMQVEVGLALSLVMSL